MSAFDIVDVMVGVIRFQGSETELCEFADCAGMLVYSDGVRLLFGRDGTEVPMEPDRWGDDLPTALAVIDREIPPDRLAQSRSGLPPANPSPGPDVWWRRWRAAGSGSFW